MRKFAALPHLVGERELDARADRERRPIGHPWPDACRDTAAVNRAARLRSVAHGGDVLLSSAAADLVIETLNAAGVQRIYGVAGDSLTGLDELTRILRLGSVKR